MAQNLSKVKEVESVVGADYVNEKLETGKWVLLEAKIVEIQNWNPNDYSDGKKIEPHLYKSFEVIYLLGRVK